jgi:imidazolonepropionase-like amidohydrolase
MTKVGSVAFVNVNVVPMNKPEVLANQTVVISDDHIADICEAASTSLADGALRIDGKNGYLLPGLADMHVHQWGQGDLLLFLANGVTTIRNMWGTSRQLVWRKKIAAGELLGPTMYTSGPLLDGKPPIWNGSKVIETAEEAEQEVAREKEAGYDFIKVYNRLSLEVYDALIAAANKYGMPVAGHIPDAVGLSHALEAGQDSIEHLTGYFSAISSDDSFKDKIKRRSTARYGAPDRIDENRISQVIADTIKAGTWNCVTLIVNQKFIPSEEALQELRRPEMKYASPLDLASWDPSKDFRTKTMTASDFEEIRKGDKLRQKLTKALHDAGAHILLGTDTPNPFVVQGFSIHEELRNLVRGGLTPYEAIRAGTVDAAQFLNATKEFGTIEVGKRADLILASRNPLADVSNLSNRVGVMVRGQWFTEEQLGHMLDELVATYPMSQKKLAGTPPLPSEGKRILSGRYQTSLSKTIIGEERFNLEKIPNDRRVIFSRSVVNSPPHLDAFQLRLELGKPWNESLLFESERLEGRGRAKMLRRNMRTVEITAKMPGQAEIHEERDVAENIILGCPLVSTYLALNSRIISLGIREKSTLHMLRFEADPEFEISETKLIVERNEDVEKKEGKVLRAYEIKEMKRNGSYESALLMDEQGRPVRFETVGQMGGLRAELIEDPAIGKSTYDSQIEP